MPSRSKARSIFFKQVAFCHPELSRSPPSSVRPTWTHPSTRLSVYITGRGWLLEHAGIGNHYFFKELLGSQNVSDVANGDIDFNSARRGNIIIDNEITQDFFIGDKYRFCHQMCVFWYEPGWSLQSSRAGRLPWTVLPTLNGNVGM